MTLMRRPRLGSHLEWHGSKIRVVVVVPPSLREKVGKGKLREVLPTADARVAEQLKWPVITRLKKSLVEARSDALPADVMTEALQWRKLIQDTPTTGEPYEVTPKDILFDHVLPVLEKEHGEERAAQLVSVAVGRLTPFSLLVDEMITDRSYPKKTADKFRHAVKLLSGWCEEKGLTPSVESIDRREARVFFRERFLLPGKNPETANDILKWYGRFWKWMREAGHIPSTVENPWDGQRMASDRKKQKAMGNAKRAFTDEEVKALLAGVTDNPFPDFMRLAALSGMRPTEIAELRVRDVIDGVFHIRDGKTVNAIRRVPVHSALADIIERRTKGRGGEEALFDDLPGHQEESPYAALSKRFTRRRRKLGIGERRENNKQDAADFYSFRRWFMRKAGEAFASGATGFTPWTIADVVGHSTEDGELPLGLTMGRYPGEASEQAKRACIEAVKLPEGPRSSGD